MSRPSDTRARIIAAGTLLFERNGYHGTGIQELCGAVGLGRGGLYHHIESKEGLLFEISRSLLENAITRAEEVVAAAGTHEQKLRALARALVEHHVQQEAGWTVALREARALTAEHRAQVIAARDAYEAIWEQVLVAGARDGAWRPVDDVELRGILGMFNSTARWMRPDGQLVAETIADRYIDLLLGGLRNGALSKA